MTEVKIKNELEQIRSQWERWLDDEPSMDWEIDFDNGSAPCEWLAQRIGPDLSEELRALGVWDPLCAKEIMEKDIPFEFLSQSMSESQLVAMELHNSDNGPLGRLYCDGMITMEELLTMTHPD